MKIKLQNSSLVVVDIQEKLQPAINENKKVLETVFWAVDIALLMNVPIFATEHCSEKIGFMPTELRKRFSDNNIISKVHFSGVTDGSLLEKLEGERNQIIVMGTEAHVCVMQTVLDLLDHQYNVFVIDSGIGSRNDDDKKRAIERMRQNGAEIITKEMLAFEWLDRADHQLFRHILKNFIK